MVTELRRQIADASASASEPLSEAEREDLWQSIWQTLADHQWADWECSCGGVREGSGEYEDNHLADVLTDLLAAREAKARAEAGEQIAQAIDRARAEYGGSVNEWLARGWRGGMENAADIAREVTR